MNNDHGAQVFSRNEISGREYWQDHHYLFQLYNDYINFELMKTAHHFVSNLIFPNYEGTSNLITNTIYNQFSG